MKAKTTTRLTALIFSTGLLALGSSVSHALSIAEDYQIPPLPPGDYVLGKDLSYRVSKLYQYIYNISDRINNLQDDLDYDRLMPSGSISASMSPNGCENGWIFYSGLNGKIPRGATSVNELGGTGGQDNHSHGISAGSYYHNYASSWDTYFLKSQQTHAASSWTPFTKVLYCQR
ncbi:hypothetical protein SG34_016690 [Thalassomonas viridans]|uniref:Uncharacterized protein n=1 Tax=Thalassomonas viridans TaxID=137584 RepID=A0AAE9YY44_9GAMM|nr:hypothetical protein [Thalassomonas viridans]WDE03063.1 hypothetical protein SG34_016690 [Thalassomonas viridans]